MTMIHFVLSLGLTSLQEYLGQSQIGYLDLDEEYLLMLNRHWQLEAASAVDSSCSVQDPPPWQKSSPWANKTTRDGHIRLSDQIQPPTNLYHLRSPPNPTPVLDFESTAGQPHPHRLQQILSFTTPLFR